MEGLLLKPNPGQHRRREATVYDAVAGRLFVTHDSSLMAYDKRLLDKSDIDASTLLHIGKPPGATGTRRRRPLAPEEALFRRKNAPPRYAEYDIYMAHERELAGNRRQWLLPDSDLLGAVHVHASHYYAAALGRRTRLDRTPSLDRPSLDRQNNVSTERTGRTGRPGRPGRLGRPGRSGRSGDRDRVGNASVDERSMDETALLAFGILLEEAAKDALGRRGDLVFTEGIDSDGRDEQTEEDSEWHSDGRNDMVGERGTGANVVGVEDTGSWRRRRAKRRKIQVETGSDTSMTGKMKNGKGKREGSEGSKGSKGSKAPSM